MSQTVVLDARVTGGDQAPSHRPALPATDTEVDSVIRPDIEWIPSFDTYQARVQRLASNDECRVKDLPDGWPAKIDSPRSWSASDFKDPSEYILTFTTEDIEEIEAALEAFKKSPGHEDPDTVTNDTFPLPHLGKRLDDVSQTLHQGRGFAVLRGLDPARYTPLDNLLIYLGVTSHIAEVRGCQDYDGRMAVHIQDIRQDVRDYAKRGPFSPYTARAQPFHTDRCDILSLYAYDVPAEGGESLLASSAKVYNEISESRPDMIHTLTKDDWIFDEFREGDYHQRPLLHMFPGNGPGFVYSRRPLTGAYFSPHYPGVPAMSEQQAEALDKVHFTAKEHALKIKLERGDIEIFNNFAMFHAREAFIDDGSGKRHLIRLWLRNGAREWEKPSFIAESSAEVYDLTGEYRSKPIWDIHWSPPLGRGTYKRMECN